MVAAESGEARASRLRALAAERQAQADRYAAMADAIEKGNHGERVVADLLDVLDGAGWCVLHDRYKPGSTANLDHVVVGPPGLFVIDAKNWTSAPLRLDDRGMSLRGHRKDDELRAAAVCARLVEQRAVGACPDLPTAGVLAFVQDMGLRVPVEHSGVWVLQSEDLLGWLTSREAKLDRATVQRVGATLDAALPPRAGGAKPLTISGITAPGRVSPGPAGGARVSRPRPGASRGPRPPQDRRRPAGRHREPLRELVVKLVALAVLVLVIVPTVLDRVSASIAEVARPQPSSAPGGSLPGSLSEPPEQLPHRPSG